MKRCPKSFVSLRPGVLRSPPSTRRCHNYSMARLRSVKTLVVANRIFVLLSKLCQYFLYNIYKLDELGLLIKLLPRCMFVFKTEGHRTVRGISAMKAKNRITLPIYEFDGRFQSYSWASFGTRRTPDAFASASLISYTSAKKTPDLATSSSRGGFYKIFLSHVRKSSAL